MAVQSERSSTAWAFRIVFVCSVGFSVVPLVNAIRQPDYNKDYSLWLGIGHVVRQDQPLYRSGANGEVQYMYPPTAAVALAPLTWLGPVGFVTVLLVVTAGSWAGCHVLAVRLANGRWSGLPIRYYLLLILATGPYVYDLFLLGQVNLFLLLLALFGSLCLRNRRSGLAGACLGLAIAIKVFPLPILVYWLARREWRAVGATLLAIVAFVFVLPGAVRGFHRNALEVEQWFGLMIGDQTGERMAARSSVGFTRRNQSLFAVAHRLTRPVEADLGLRVNLFDLAPRSSQLVGLTAIVLLGGVFLLATRGRFAPSPDAESMETAMVLVLTVLCSPLAWTYFFCWLLPAWAVLLKAGQFHRWAIRTMILAGVLLASALTEQFDARPQAYGVTAAGSAVLFLSLARLRFQIHSSLNQ
jgi:alpha-1,2-mannosyltransferase